MTSLSALHTVGDQIGEALMLHRSVSKPEALELVAHGERFLIIGLGDSDAHNRAYAAWTLGLLKAEGARAKLETLQHDKSEIRTFRDGEIIDLTVGDMVRDALSAIA